MIILMLFKHFNKGDEIKNVLFVDDNIVYYPKEKI